MSFTQTNVNAAIFGMAGCTQLVGLDATTFFIVAPPLHPFSIAIPGATSLLGTIVFAQAATVSAGFNQLGVIASNGGELRVGL
jgi:hypothetical protein